MRVSPQKNVIPRPASTVFLREDVYNKSIDGFLGVGMVEEIYGDVLFIINFSMDFLSLFMVGKLLHLGMRTWRVILGSSLGALYGVVELLLDAGDLVSFLMTAAVMLLMCLTAFGRQRGGRFVMAVLLFCGINMLVGGAMTAAFVRLGAYEQYIEIGGDLHTVYGDMPVWLFAVLASLSALFTYLVGRVFRRARAVRSCEIRVLFGGESAVLTGLVDSGNLLTEPLSGTPVIFVKESAASFLSAKLLEAMRTGEASVDCLAGARLRFVPSRTVSGDGLLIAAVPERVELGVGGAWEARRALIAVDFTDGDFGGFEALVPEILL